MRRLPWLLGLGSLLAGAGPAEGVERLPWLNEYAITYWWGPPVGETTAARYEEVAAAGFNLACPQAPSEPGAYHPYFSAEDNLRMLDRCQEAGLKAIVADVRTHAAFVREEEWKPLLDAVAAEYRDHPALAGYYLIDEPHAGMFEKLGAMSAYLREVDPDHFSYVNLFPNYAPPDFLRTDTYREYVERYVAEVQPPFICYDNYHFLNPELVRGGEVFASEEERRLFDIAHATGPRETLFFENLDIVRDVARENGLPFMVIVLLVEHGPYRELGEADLRWEAFQCLAHGASGVSYFSYWAPPYEENWRFRGAALTFEGERTPRYDAVKRVNRDLRVYGNALLGRELLSVTRVSEETPFKPAGGLQRVEGGAVTVGVFTGGYALLANRSPYESIEVTVEAEKDKALQMLQSETGGLGSLGEAGQPIALKLGPGEGALLVVSQSKAGQ